jgi:hypothetical protein
MTVRMWPFLLVATASSTDTGTIDTLPRPADLARREDGWFHIDAVYGGVSQCGVRCWRRAKHAVGFDGESVLAGVRAAGRRLLHTAVDITKVANDLIDEGWEVDPVDLATVTPYITSKPRRFGTWYLDMEPPENEAVGRLRMAA